MPTPLVISRADFHDKVHACWLGKNIGGTLGAPYECRREKLDLTYYDPVPTVAAPNDDLDLQLVWLEALETYGCDPTVSQLGQTWAAYASAYPWNEYGFFMRNWSRGLRPPMAGCFENYFVDEEGSPIRSEIWAVLHAGDPQAAARMAWKDSVLDHAGGEGQWGEMFLAALEAAAFVEQDPYTLIDIGLAMIPIASHLGRAVREAVWCHRNDLTWDEARQRVTDRFAGLQPCNAVPNTAFVILGWLYGADFGDRLLKAVNCGWDTDCTGATLGSLLGILHGTAGIPARWTAPIGEIIINHPFTRLPRAPQTVGELTRRSIALAEQAVTASTERSFGERTVLPPDLRSRLFRNHVTRDLQTRDLQVGVEDLAGHEVALHYGGDPVLQSGIARELAVTIDGLPAVEARLATPATWTCQPLGEGRFRVECAGPVAARNRLDLSLPGLGSTAFTLLGPEEAQGFGAGDNVAKCPLCQARAEACICLPAEKQDYECRIARSTWIGAWHLIGPFPSPTSGSISLDQDTAVDADFRARGDGSVDFARVHRVASRDLTWRARKAAAGKVDLIAWMGTADWSFAYAYAEITSAVERRTVLRCGSDDGIRIWLNGEQVHSHEVARGCQLLDDEVPIRLVAGVNRLLVKIDNYTYGWGFGVGIDKCEDA